MAVRASWSWNILDWDFDNVFLPYDGIRYVIVGPLLVAWTSKERF